MRGVFERIFRGTAMLVLLVVLVAPVALADGELPGSLEARINPPIGVTASGELSFLEWVQIWAELGLLTPGL